MDIEIVHEEVFTFTPENSDEGEINVYSGRLRKYLLEHAMDLTIDLTFPVETAQELVERHGIEQDRLDSMTEEEAKEPVIIGCIGNTHILIDGAHRRAFWAQKGINAIRGWAVPELVWRQFTFETGQAGKDIPGCISTYDHPDGSLLPQRRKKGDH